MNLGPTNSTEYQRQLAEMYLDEINENEQHLQRIATFFSNNRNPEKRIELLNSYVVHSKEKDRPVIARNLYFMLLNHDQIKEVAF